MHSPSADQLRLLQIIDSFTGARAKSGKKHRWVKDLHLSILVYHAIEKGLFDDYDWAPSLVEFHGVKMYGKVSQEANADLRSLQSAKLIEKVHLSTCLYDSIRAYRTSLRAAEALVDLPTDCRFRLDRMLRCQICRSLRQIMAYVEKSRANGSSENPRNRTVLFCPGCSKVEKTTSGVTIRTKVSTGSLDIDFFQLADVSYRSRPISQGERS